MVTRTFRTPWSTASGLVAGALIGLAFAAPVSAQSHRARMARDVSERIAQRIEAATEFIVRVPADRVDALAARYGPKIKKRIHGGAVFEATGGQIDALSQDTDVDHIATNAKVFRMMAVTTQSTGADQAWSG